MEIKLKKYEAYKDSGVEWLGQIPESWEVKKFKHVFHEKRKTTNVELNCGSISFGKVVYKDDEKIPEATKRSYQVLSKGDFLINPLNLNYDLISLRIGLSYIDVVVSSGYIIVKNSVEINKEYYKWLLHIFDIAYMKTLGSGVRQTLSFTHIANSELVYPPLKEQTAIAKFLDDKIAKIDKAISIKQKQIDLLRERRQILIHKAVTRGINPNVKLKDSGVEWIGEIPEHWEVKKLKHLYITTFSGGTPSTDILKYWDGGVSWISSADVKTSFMSETLRNISNLGLENSSSKIAPKGSIIIVTRSGILQHTLPIAILTKDMAINQDIKCFILNTKFIIAEYLLSFIQGKNSEILADTRKQGATVESVEMTDFINLRIPVPSVKVQEEIIVYLANISIKISSAISLKEKEIEKLKEYKASLINSVVTGKVRVS